MRGVSIPTHEYARVADAFMQSQNLHPSQRDPALIQSMRSYTASSRAYTRVVLRLRAQAEKEVSVNASRPAANTAAPPSAMPRMNGAFSPTPSAYSGRPPSRSTSRAPSRSSSPSLYSFHGHGSAANLANGHARPPLPTTNSFRSPLFKLKRAPLLRVFVPSPEGDWLSDQSILECEAELKRAGVQHLLRVGDVIWDVAVGDEGNVGRLVWDGSYLIVGSDFLDLDVLCLPLFRILIIHIQPWGIPQNICRFLLSLRHTSTESFALVLQLETQSSELISRHGERKSLLISSCFRTAFVLRRLRVMSIT